MEELTRVEPCKNCGEILILGPGVIEENYNNGVIKIDKASYIYLARNVVTKREGYGSTAFFYGHYCNVNCLTEKINNIRKDPDKYESKEMKEE